MLVVLRPRLMRPIWCVPGSLLPSVHTTPSRCSCVVGIHSDTFFSRCWFCWLCVWSVHRVVEGGHGGIKSAGIFLCMYTNCPPPCRPCGQQKQAPTKGLERRFVLLRVEARRRVLPYCRLQVPCDVRCPRWIPVPHQFPFRHQVAQWYLGRVGPRTSKKKRQAHQGRELAIDKTGGARAVISVERGKQLFGGRFKKTIGRECKGI